MIKVDMDNIREQIQVHLLDYLAELDVETSSNGGIYFKCINPDHDDNNPSCHIIPGTNNKEFKCFACGATGDIFTAASYLENKPIGSDPDFYQDTVIYLAEKYGIQFSLGKISKEDEKKFAIRRALQFAARYLVEQKPSDEFLKELEKRDWDADRVKRLGVGQITDYDSYKKLMLEDNGFDEELLEDIDLLGSNAKWMFNKDRMVFTFNDHKGRPIGFAARNLKYEEEKAEGIKTVKYRNSKTTALFEKKKMLYNLDGAYEHPEKIVYIFEGQADVITYRLKTGQSNCVAIGGTSFTDDHVDLLKELSIRHVCLCLDGDDPGRKKTSDIVGHLGGNPGLSVSVITMPSNSDENDVDSFLRKYDIDAWNEAKDLAVSAFKWKLQHRDNDQPIEVFIEDQTANIINEQIPIKREAMIRELSESTNVPLDVIRDQVIYKINTQEHEYKEKSIALADQTAKRLSTSPEDADMVITRYQQQKESLDKEYGTDIISSDFQIRLLDDLRERELDSSDDTYIKVGWPIFDERTQGIPAEDTIFFVGGKANVGKTSLFSNLALDILANNSDTIVLVYTIDDSYSKFVPRMTARLAGLPTHWVKRPYGVYRDRGMKLPAKFLPNGFNDRQEIVEAGNDAHKVLREYIKEGRLKVVDAPASGATWAYADKWVKQVRKNNPTMKIVLFLDNFHNLRDFAGGGAREKFTELANLIRNTTSSNNIMVFSTIEYTKLPDKVKPSNSNLAESRTMEYVADGIIHLVNAMHEFRAQPKDLKVFWNDPYKMESIIDENGVQQIVPIKHPVVEMMFGKSKISSFKGSIFFKFNPELCRFEEGTEQEQKEWYQRDRAMPWGSFGGFR